MLKALFWQVIAWIVTREPVTQWLMKVAVKTPYSHLYDNNGHGSLYMGRWWVFNPYPKEGARRRWIHRLPSARIHWICRADLDRHLHDHPWNARTIILRGWYTEERPIVPGSDITNVWRRVKGYTGQLLFGQYHRIQEVSRDGVCTLFITWKKQGTWGFNVDGVKVPHRLYAQGARA